MVDAPPQPPHFWRYYRLDVLVAVAFVLLVGVLYAGYRLTHEPLTSQRFREIAEKKPAEAEALHAIVSRSSYDSAPFRPSPKGPATPPYAYSRKWKLEDGHEGVIHFNPGGKFVSYEIRP